MHLRVIVIAAVCLTAGLLVGAGLIGGGPQPTTTGSVAQAQTGYEAMPSVHDGSGATNDTSPSLKSEEFGVFMEQRVLSCVAFRDSRRTLAGRTLAVDCNWEKFNKSAPDGITRVP